MPTLPATSAKSFNGISRRTPKTAVGRLPLDWRRARRICYNCSWVMTVLKVQILRGAEAFQSIEKDWRGLEERAGATVFQSWDWCDCWLSLYGRGSLPIIIRADSENRAVGLAPLVRQRSWLGLPLRRVAFIGTGPGDYGGFLTSPGGLESEQALAEALGLLEFDLLDLHQLEESTASRVRDALKADFNVSLIEQEPVFTVDLPGDFDSYLSSLSKKFRSNTIYAKRRLNRDFTLTHKRYLTESEIAAGMDLFFQLHQQRWLAKRLPGLFLGGRNRRFHHSLAARLAARDRLVLSIVSLNGRPAAAFYGFNYAQTYSYYLGGFDPALAKFSVSSVLILELLEKAISDGAAAFDFLRGREAYKQRWGAKEKPLFRLVAWPSTARGRLGGRMARRHNNMVQRARAKLHS